MNSEPNLAIKRRLPRLGIWLAAIYLVVVLGVYVLTAITTKPENVGYDWIPFWALALPWSRMDTGLLFPGFLLNGLILFLLGSLFQGLFLPRRKT